ncbi:hypothetical protein SAMN05421835_12194 [Amycolatopsis sacchari]|uniref:Uncharacterized protein n=1 Tax=Amycolatopsis sacchari TaxID=115433 RepID=A0A1I3ZLG7_9PSEU|nr:hypothetical protein SAMN05421835_12194 [Amycolatopsis sacchari]
MGAGSAVGGWRRAGAAASGGERRRAAASGGERRRAAASGGERRRAAASGGERRRAAASGGADRRRVARVGCAGAGDGAGARRLRAEARPGGGGAGARRRAAGPTVVGRRAGSGEGLRRVAGRVPDDGRRARRWRGGGPDRAEACDGGGPGAPRRRPPRARSRSREPQRGGVRSRETRTTSLKTPGNTHAGGSPPRRATRMVASKAGGLPLAGPPVPGEMAFAVSDAMALACPVPGCARQREDPQVALRRSTQVSRGFVRTRRGDAARRTP